MRSKVSESPKLKVLDSAYESLPPDLYGLYFCSSAFYSSFALSDHSQLEMNRGNLLLFEAFNSLKNRQQTAQEANNFLFSSTHFSPPRRVISGLVGYRKSPSLFALSIPSQLCTSLRQYVSGRAFNSKTSSHPVFSTVSKSILKFFKERSQIGSVRLFLSQIAICDFSFTNVQRQPLQGEMGL